jgi:hypothetical protein
VIKIFKKPIPKPPYNQEMIHLKRLVLPAILSNRISWHQVNIGVVMYDPVKAKVYRQNHKEHRNQYNKDYRLNHKEKYRNYSKKYHKTHNEEIKNYRLINEPHFKEYRKNYRLKNNEKIKAYNRKYWHKHHHPNPIVKAVKQLIKKLRLFK